MPRTEVGHSMAFETGKRIGIAVSLLVTIFCQPVAAVEFMPHEARYDAALESIEGAGVALRAGGSYSLRVTRDCQKWKITEDLVLNIEIQDSDAVQFLVTHRFYEGLDGRRGSWPPQHAGGQEWCPRRPGVWPACPAVGLTEAVWRREWSHGSRRFSRIHSPSAVQREILGK